MWAELMASAEANLGILEARTLLILIWWVGPPLLLDPKWDVQDFTDGKICLESSRVMRAWGGWCLLLNTAILDFLKDRTWPARGECCQYVYNASWPRNKSWRETNPRRLTDWDYHRSGQGLRTTTDRMLFSWPCRTDLTGHQAMLNRRYGELPDWCVDIMEKTESWQKLQELKERQTSRKARSTARMTYIACQWTLNKLPGQDRQADPP